MPEPSRCRQTPASAQQVSWTLNPAGLQHGPRPGVKEASRRHWQKDARLEFTAINIDVERSLPLTDIATAAEIPDYYTQWMRPAATTTGR